ncbi:AAA family ATPase [Telmatospirillum sp.]|uniref:AAA family ATPase n=1 Tax=Telmatospirillum sp. TaxID=2079197 RepID=UPI00284694D9|nr:AAA family ATPase [Telmatospirillum sp.]MDR3437934.1 AAA family ATPase [Telmatospirillum sp.]
MIIHLNGLPGVGKLTIARLIVARLGGHLLDNHTIYNVAFSLTEFRTPEFYSVVRSVRDVAFAQVAKIPADVSVVMTNALGAGPWGQENLDAIIDLARRRNCAFFAVTLTCSAGALAHRMTTPERSYLRKLTDPTALRFAAGDLLEPGSERLLRLDKTSLSPDESADRIIRRLQDGRSQVSMSNPSPDLG